MLQSYEGGCHCGRVRFRVKADLATLSECNCSICLKKGILHLGAAKDDFELLSGQDAIETYRFGTGTAQHNFCRHCGIHAFGVPRVYPDRITVNARCLDNIDPAQLKPARFFDGRHWEEAARRRRAEDGLSG